VDNSAEAGVKDSEGGAMSDEQRKDEEIEVEGHAKHAENDEPAQDETEDEVEAHVRRANVRMDSPRHI
jgi:hypothetical protein